MFCLAHLEGWAFKFKPVPIVSHSQVSSVRWVTVIMSAFFLKSCMHFSIAAELGSHLFSLILGLLSCLLLPWFTNRFDFYNGLQTAALWISVSLKLSPQQIIQIPFTVCSIFFHFNSIVKNSVRDPPPVTQKDIAKFITRYPDILGERADKTIEELGFLRRVRAHVFELAGKRQLSPLASIQLVCCSISLICVILGKQFGVFGEKPQILGFGLGGFTGFFNPMF